MSVLCQTHIRVFIHYIGHKSKADTYKLQKLTKGSKTLGNVSMCMCVCVCVYACMLMHVCMCVCMHVCMYVCIHEKDQQDANFSL